MRGENVPAATGVRRLVDGRASGLGGDLPGGPGEAVLGAGEVDVDAELGEGGSLWDRRPAPSWLTGRALVRPALHVLAIQPVVAVGKVSSCLSHSIGIRPEPGGELTEAPGSPGPTAATDQCLPPSEVQVRPPSVVRTSSSNTPDEEFEFFES